MKKSVTPPFLSAKGKKNRADNEVSTLSPARFTDINNLYYTY